ncbi:hypothetical protein AB0J47_02585 [Nocardia sp. NPDC049737]|uniref:hypothetical protein n=1 Tax=Nocardia sp. NPDC049737 TaxID=3154358 RepID=UPI00344A83B2
MSEPFHDPVELLDELDSIIQAQELLRQCAIALQARYAALEPHAERYNNPPPSGDRSPIEEYGRINVKYTAIRLGDAVKAMAGTAEFHLHPARELAEKVREYPQPEREQPAGATAPTSALATVTGHTLADLVNGRERDERDGAER